MRTISGLGHASLPVRGTCGKRWRRRGGATDPLRPRLSSALAISARIPDPPESNGRLRRWKWWASRGPLAGEPFSAAASMRRRLCAHSRNAKLMVRLRSPCGMRCNKPQMSSWTTTLMRCVMPALRSVMAIPTNSQVPTPAVPQEPAPTWRPSPSRRSPLAGPESPGETSETPAPSPVAPRPDGSGRRD